MTSDKKSLKNLVRYSLLASIATVIQMSILIFPGIGQMFGPLTTLPIALAAYISPRGGIFCYIIAIWLTMSIMPSEAPILALCTGPLGLALGWSLYHNLRQKLIIMIGTVVFTGGMLSMTKLLGIPFFGSVIPGHGLSGILLIYAGFSLLYSYAWTGLVRKIIRQLERVGVEL